MKPENRDQMKKDVERLRSFLIRSKRWLVALATINHDPDLKDLIGKMETEERRVLREGRRP